MTGASNWEKVAGDISPTFQLGGPTGPLWSASSSNAIEARGSDSNLATVRGAPPVLSQDLVNLGYATGSLGLVRAISAGTALASSGTIILSNSNGISFGLSGNTVTASFNAAANQFAGLGAGTQTATSGTVVFSNSNGVTFGMQGNSLVTASASYAPTLKFFENLSGVMLLGSTYASLSIVPLAANVFPGQMTASTFFIGVNGISSQSLASGSMVFSFGIYTLNAATLSLLNSATTGFSWAASSDNSSNYSGPRWMSVTSWSAPLVLTQTNYWLGYAAATTNATQGVMWIGQAFANAQARYGTLGVGALAPAGSYGWRPMMGGYTTATANLPAAISPGDLNGSFTLVGNFVPHIILVNALSAF